MKTLVSFIRILKFQELEKSKYKRCIALGLVVMLTATLFVLPSCTGSSANTITETRSVSSFTDISNSADAIINVSIGKTESLKITGSSDILKSVATKVSEGTLYIDTQMALLPPDRPTINIAMPRLDSFTNIEDSDGEVIISDLSSTDVFGLEQDGLGIMELDGSSLNGLMINKSGSGDLNLSDLDVTGALIIDMSDDGNINFNSVQADTIEIQKTDSGDVMFKNLTVNGDLSIEVMGGLGDIQGDGTANNLIIRKFDAGGNILLSDVVVTNNVDVDMWAYGNVEVNPSKSLTGSNNGSGDLIYVANTGVNVQVDNIGTGNVKPQ